jgi:hypothetical protein
MAAMPATAGMRGVVDRLIEHWDDAVANDVFAANMDLDEPRESRRAALERVATDLGPLTLSVDWACRLTTSDCRLMTGD